MTAAPTPAIPRVLHQTWRTTALPPRLAAFRETWKRYHPGWTHRFWTDGDLRAFVAGFAPELLAIFDGYAQPICRVDMARYLILERLGGVYADLDMECVRPIDPLLDGRQFVIGREPDRHGTFGHSVTRGMERFWCPSVIASAPGHPIWQEVRRGLIEARGAPDVLDATGPYLLTRAGARYRGAAPVTELAPDAFYPLDKIEAWQGALFDPERREAVTRTAYAIHHWDGSWFRRRVPDSPEPLPRRIAVHLTRGGIESLEQDVGAPRPMDLHLDRRDHPDPPLVSCLMVTRARAPLAAVAIECFRRQSWPARELVIIDDDEDDTLARHVAGLADPTIRMVRLPAEGRALGALRNRAIGAARGDFVCQWDDDDLHDPLRLEIQMEALARAGAVACYLRRWTQWWPAAGRIALSTRRIWEGSMLARKDALPDYPALRRGEDSAPTLALCRRHRVVHLDAPRLAVYVAHGRNTHHAVHYENMWEWATARFEGDRYRGVRDDLARRLPLDAYETALAAMAAADRRTDAHPPSPVRPVGDLRAIARASATGRPVRSLSAWDALLARDPGDGEALAGRALALARLGRLEEADAAYVALDRRRPDGAAAPLGRAEVALARGDRDAALARCEEAASARSTARAVLQRADLLLRLDRPAEADRAFAAAAALGRAREAAVGRATAAARRLDWEAALAIWREAWDRHRASEAPVGIVTALVRLERPAEARAFVDKMEGRNGEAGHHRQAALRLARLLQDWEGVLRITETGGPDRAPTRDERRMRVEALLLADRAGEALTLCDREASASGVFQTVRVLLRLGALGRAHALLAAATEASGVARMPIELLPELIAARRARRGHVAVFRLLDRIEKDRTVPVELRLAAPFERHAEECRAALRAPAAALPGPGPTEAAIAERLGAPGRADAPEVVRLRRTCAAIAAIRARHRAFHPDALTSLSDALAVAERIAAAIARAEPLALVRLGDGEGNFLPYATENEERHRRADQASIQRIWWSGGPLPDDAVRAIERDLAAAIRAADIVGIPEPYRLCRLWRAGLPANQTSRGAQAVVDQLAGAAPAPDGGPLGRPDQIVTGAHVHTAFEHWRMWDLVLARIDRCALVTGRADAAAHVARRFAIAVDRTYRVPGERKYRRDAADPAEPPHYPDRFATLGPEIRVRKPGEVFLVAAGVLGKVYCAWIRAQGGIALDVGSALDHWCGQRTRTAFEATWFRPPPGLLASYAARPSLDAEHPDLAPATTAARLLARGTAR